MLSLFGNGLELQLATGKEPISHPLPLFFFFDPFISRLTGLSLASLVQEIDIMVTGVKPVILRASLKVYTQALLVQDMHWEAPLVAIWQPSLHC